MDKSDEQRMREDFQTLCIQAYNNWRNERIQKGAKISQVTQNKFCAKYGFAPTSWSGWVNEGRIPTDLSNIRALAACPYIGERVYSILGLRPQVEDQRLQEVINTWPLLSDNERRDILDTLRKSENYQVERNYFSGAA